MTIKIAVIGGGLAGLAVAHALERSMRVDPSIDIQVTVYETREDEMDIQRYPIHLDPSRAQTIRPEQAYRRLIDRAAQGTDHGGITLFTPRLSRLLRMRQYEGQQPQFVHRWVLKEVLSQGVKIVRGRRVAQVDDIGERVRLLFGDGGTEDADFVVGADGVGSTLRSQLYPSHKSFERLPYVNIQMKLATPPDRLPASMDRYGINAILGTQDCSVLLVPFHGDTQPNLPVPQDTESRDKVNEAMQETLKALDRPHPQFLFAILTIRCFDGWKDLTATDWQAKAVELFIADQADPTMIEAFEKDVIPGTVGWPWQVVSFDPDRPVPYDGGRVILIGDAAHAMPPQAGAGASTALMDAHKLTQTILAGLTDRGLTDFLPGPIPS